MNQHPEMNDFDEMHDRLIDQGLHEVLGEQQPPDLCARILAAAAPAAGATAVAVAARPPQAPTVRPGNSGRYLKPLAVAAGLLVALGGGALLIRPWNASVPQQDIARSSGQLNTHIKSPVANNEVSSVEPLVLESAGDQQPMDLDLRPLIAEHEQPLKDGKASDLSKYFDDSPKFEDAGTGLKSEATTAVPLSGRSSDFSHLHSGPAMKGLGGLGTGAREGLDARGDGVHDDFESSRRALAKRIEEKNKPLTAQSVGSQRDAMALEKAGKVYFDEARLTPHSRMRLPQALSDGYDHTMANLVKGDAEYRSRVDKVRDLEQQLKATTQVAKDPNSPIVRMARQEVAQAQASADQRKAQLNGALAQAWTEGKSVAISDKPGDKLRELREEMTRDPKPMETADEGRGPGEGGDRYRRIVENPFLEALSNPLSTFSIDVDTASYANVRQFLMQQKTLPPADAVRLEELINYFPYNYAGPEDARPFASHVEVAQCPWADGHKVVRVAIKGRDVADKRPRANLVFLIDVSGSMDEPAKLPLLVQGLKLLTEQLRSNDRVAIVVYAGNSGLVLPSTAGEGKDTILAALNGLKAGGSTNGGAGINLAYKVAKENFVAGGINRVILCTDGDFNVGVTSDSSLERIVEEKAKEGTFLTVLGFGRGNFNDSMLEAISGKGNGNYAYVDNIAEARKVLVEQLSGTLMTIAKDVKIQVEFNPAKVAGYRLLGYEDRMLKAEDFNNDKKDAGEIGSGHTVTALYEIVPARGAVPATKVDELRYQQPQKLSDAAATELLTLKIRYKEPTAEKSQLIEVPIRDDAKKFAAATSDFQFAAAVAGFGMLLRSSEHKGTLTYDAVLEIAAQHKGKDVNGYRGELLEMMRRAKQLAGN